jgi:hypothetical protein
VSSRSAKAALFYEKSLQTREVPDEKQKIAELAPYDVASRFRRFGHATESERRISTAARRSRLS